MRTRIVQLKVKIKSLAAEAQIIRHEATRAGPVLEADLTNHRRLVVRPAARVSLLAYAALRGVPYERVEARASLEPRWEEVLRVAERFGVLSAGERDAQRARLEAWRDAGRAWRDAAAAVAA